MGRVADTSSLQAVGQSLGELYPGASVVSIERLNGADDGDGVALGESLLIRLQMLDGQVVDLVFQTKDGASPSLRRRADRAGALLAAFDGFPRIPRHARALDVGFVARDGSLCSLRDSGEFYLVTELVPGFVYAEQLRAIAERGRLEQTDLDRVNEIALCLAELHARVTDAPAYRFAIRELVGGTDGVLGLIDAYPAETPGAPRVILEHIERLVLPWRWKLREFEHRSMRVHGDLHPFNVAWTDQGPCLLGAGRRGVGEPAEDVIGVALDFVTFGLLWPGTWKPCFRRLWNAFWNAYLGETSDAELLQVVAPFLVRRALCLCSPVGYPGTPASVRERLLGLAEQALAAPRFDPALVEVLFRDEEPHSLR